MKTLVRQWAEEDFDGVIAWSRSLSDRAAASQFLNTLIGDLAKEDQEGALDLVLSLRGDPDLKLFSAESLFNTAARRGVATALDLVSSYKKTKGRVSSFQAFEFPEGFDFATFANEARQFQSGRFGSVDLPFFPSNLMREWAKADFDEAFAFYVNHQQFRGNRFRDVLSEGFDLSDRETLFSWASEQFSVLEGEQRFRFASGLKEALGSGEIKSFIQNLPGERAQQEFVEELLRDGVDNSRFMEQLEVFPSVAERMDVIRRTNAFDNYGDRLREVLAVAGINEERGALRCIATGIIGSVLLVLVVLISGIAGSAESANDDPFDNVPSVVTGNRAYGRSGSGAT